MSLFHPTIQTNVDFFDRRFTEGYGLRYPESHVIRFNLQILKHVFGLTKGCVLDFGCALGAHARYFADAGFDVVACDSSPTAIAKAKEIHPHLAGSFFVNDPVPDFRDLDGEFDVIFCNQVLAYFTNAALRHLIGRFHALTRPGGVFFATQYPIRNGLIDYVTGEAPDAPEMKEITLGGRLRGVEYLTFKTKQEMVEDFLPYEKVRIGFTAMEWDDDPYGSSEQLLYVGVKK